MWPWLILGVGGAGLVLAAASDSSGSSSSSSSSSTGGGVSTTGQPPEHTTIPDSIEMTCDQALATLPTAMQAPVWAALTSGSVASAINALADQMDALGDKLGTMTNQTNDTIRSEAAFHIIAHCLRARADAITLSPQVPNKATAFAA